MKAVITGENLNKLINSTKKFTSYDDHNRGLSWIRIEFHKKSQSARAIAVDGYRLAVENTLCETVVDDFIIYIKPNIRKINKKEQVSIELEQGKALIQSGEFIVGYCQPEVDFMDYQQVLKGVLKEPIKYKILFNGDLLIDALQSAKASLGGSFGEAITLEFRNELIPIVLKTGEENIKLVLPMKAKS